MRAARLHEIGGPLQVDSIEDPTPTDDEVLVDISYASVNPLDVWVAQGGIGAAAGQLPWTPGTEAAGHLDGRPVLLSGGGLGVARPGLYRERAAVPPATVMALPDDVDLRQAAALGVAGVTAWSALHDRAQLQPGDRVLVLGASGGVGSLALSLARAAGVTVWGQTTAAGKAAAIERSGADRVVVASAAELVAAVEELAPTVVLDGVGGEFTPAAVTAVAPTGRIVVYGTSAGEVSAMNLRTLYRKGVTLLGYAGLLLSDERRRTILGQLLAEVAAGALEVPVEVLPLADANECHQRILRHDLTGKLVLDVHA